MTDSMERSERILVKYPLFKTAVARVQACFDSHEATAEPDCCPIVGESGSGKTTIISYFASLLRALTTSGVWKCRCWLQRSRPAQR